MKIVAEREADLVDDKLADVIIPDVYVNLLNVYYEYGDKVKSLSMQGYF